MLTCSCAGSHFVCSSAVVPSSCLFRIVVVLLSPFFSTPKLLFCCCYFPQQNYCYCIVYNYIILYISHIIILCILCNSNPFLEIPVETLLGELGRSAALPIQQDYPFQLTRADL